MKKNVIRITESELKNYIRKIVSEQTVPVPPKVDVNQIKSELSGKNVQLFTDAGKSQKYTVVNILQNITLGQSGVMLYVNDLTFVDDNRQYKKLEPGQNKVWRLDFACGTRDKLTAHLEDFRGSQSKVIVYSPQLQEKLTGLMGCPATLNRNVDLASVSNKTTNPVNRTADFG